MTQERPSPPPPPRSGRTEPWRVERMVQRVPAHLGESTRESVSGWVMLAGVILLLVVVCAVLFILIGGPAGLGFAAATATPTRTRVTAPAVTILPVTLPPLSPTPAPTVAIVKYKVKPGDSLLAIAAKYRVSVQAIMTANGLKDETIRSGDELIIPLPTPTPLPGSKPPPSGGTPTPLSLQSPPTSATAAGPAGVIRHTVQRGDTLIAIAATYGSTVDAIRIANQLESDLLSIGQVLQVPVGAWTPTATAAPAAGATATPTLQFAYPAPNLISPAENQEFRGKQNAPTLAWTSPAILKPNEFYVVHVEYGMGAEKKAWSFQVRQGTSKTLDETHYPGQNAQGTRVTWYVVIISQTSPRAPDQTPQSFAQSPPSATRVFVWY